MKLSFANHFLVHVPILYEAFHRLVIHLVHCLQIISSGYKCLPRISMLAHKLSSDCFTEKGSSLELLAHSWAYFYWFRFQVETQLEEGGALTKRRIAF